MLDGCTVGTTRELLSSLRDKQGLSSKSGTWCQSDARHHILTSLRVLNLVSRLHIYEVPCGLARRRMGCFVLVNQQNRLNQRITGTRVYISLFPVFPSILFSSQIEHPVSTLNSLDDTWLAQNNVSHSKTHPIIYTTLYVPSRLSSTAFNLIIMLTHPV